MWEEEYEKLSAYDKGEFRRIGNYLLSHTYIVSSKYNTTKQFIEYSNDYRVALNFFSLLQGYFKIIGWRIEKDDDYGVISIVNDFDYNRARFDKFTTLFLFTCRLIYEEERQELSSFNCVRTDTAAIVGKMRALGLLEKDKTTQKERDMAQRTLVRFNILEKIDLGGWSAEGNNLLILPSILTVVSTQNILEMIDTIEQLELETDEEDFDDFEGMQDSEEGELTND